MTFGIEFVEELISFLAFSIHEFLLLFDHCGLLLVYLDLDLVNRVLLPQRRDVRNIHEFAVLRFPYEALLRYISHRVLQLLLAPDGHFGRFSFHNTFLCFTVHFFVVCYHDWFGRTVLNLLVRLLLKLCKDFFRLAIDPALLQYLLDNICHRRRAVVLSLKAHSNNNLFKSIRYFKNG